MILFLQADPSASGFMFLAMMAIMVVLFILPQFRRQKREKKFREELRKGMSVITTGGIHGKLGDVHDSTVILETGAGKLTVEKGAISMEMTTAKQNKKDK